MIEHGGGQPRWVKPAALLAAMWVAATCASDERATQGTFVCFTLATEDWQQIGAFQQRFIVNGQNLRGMTGFTLRVSDASQLSITLAPATDPEAWLDALPDGIRDDSAVGSVEVTTKDCAS